MAKQHQTVNQKKSKNTKTDKNSSAEQIEYPEQVEKIYKLTLRVLSWVVGVAFVLIIVLPEFNSSLLDKITRIIYLLGISSLIIFMIIEFFSNSLKKFISRIVHA